MIDFKTESLEVLPKLPWRSRRSPKSDRAGHQGRVRVRRRLTNRRGYSRPAVSVSSVNMIGLTLLGSLRYRWLSRVCLVIWSSAVVDQGCDTQRGDVSCEKRKGETNSNAHRCVAGSVQQQRRLDLRRPLLGAHSLIFGIFRVFPDNCK